MKLRCLLPVLILVCAGCARKLPQDEIYLPPSSPLSRSVIGYGVVNSSYTHVLDKRGAEGMSLGLLRKGAIVEILERRPVVDGEKAESWVFASGAYSGWLREDEMRVFDSRAQAETAAGTLRQ